MAVDNLRQVACASGLADMNPVHRCYLMERLVIERLHRKANDMLAYYEECKDWVQVFHVLLFRYIGSADTRGQLATIARTVTSRICEREYADRGHIEAMLVGASGLLEGRLLDNYCRELMADYEYLQHKYQLRPPLYYGDWRYSSLYPSTHPLVRLSQLTAIISDNNLLIDRVFSCRTADDVYQIFDVACSDYWAAWCRATSADGGAPRVGRTKANMLGINVVVPFLYAYGRELGKQHFCDQAIELLESLRAESNKYTRFWTGYDVPMNSATDSQALLQLSTCYCEAGRCDECEVGKFCYGRK